MNDSNSDELVKSVAVRQRGLRIIPNLRPAKRSCAHSNDESCDQLQMYKNTLFKTFKLQFECMSIYLVE